MSQRRSHGIGPYSRYRLEKTSPFGCMILKVAQGLSEDEVSQLKLALYVDKHVTTQVMSTLKNGAEVMLYLYTRNFISKTDASFLIELLKQINRVDLGTLVEKHFKEDLNVALEAVAISSSQRPLSESPARQPFLSSHPRLARRNNHHNVNSVIDEETVPKEICHICVPVKQIRDQNALHLSYEDTNLEKVSHEETENNEKYWFTFQESKEAIMFETSSSQSSQMSVDDGLNLSQNSMMSISDDEKLSHVEKSMLRRTDDYLETFVD